MSRDNRPEPTIPPRFGIVGAGHINDNDIKDELIDDVKNEDAGERFVEIMRSVTEQ